MVADNLRAFIRLAQPVLSEALGMCRYYVVMLETVFALTRFQRVWSQEPDGDLLTGLGLAWTHASLPASNPRCAHLGCVDCTVQFSSRCKCEKHVAALPHHFGCLDSSDLLSPPPLLLSLPCAWSSREGRGRPPGRKQQAPRHNSSLHTYALWESTSCKVGTTEAAFIIHQQP